MKIAMTILLALMISLPAIAEDIPVQDQSGMTTADLRLLLNSFTALGEAHVDRVLSGLKIISVTEEARSGKWGKMEKVLAEFEASGIQASAVWFMLPDGSYYLVGRGLTDQDSSDRPYFQRLMAGEDIAGDLVIGKATGALNAIVAVPIKKDGKIIGALGASLALQDISRTINEKMGLPHNIFFYALDQKGQACLHKISSLVFAYPSEMGSKSLTNSIGEMLTKPEGAVTYDFYGERSVVYKKAPLTGWVYAIGIATGKPGPGAELPPILTALEREITTEFYKLDRDVAILSKELSEKVLTTADKRRLLGELCRSYPYAVDCTVVDRNGKMIIIEPQKYTEFEGSDISSQEQVIRLRKTMKPVLSNVFKSVEGLYAVDLEHPLFSSQGEFAGGVSILIRPESLFAHILTPVLQGVPVESFVMQTDGRVLYDQDKEEIGRMIFEDPMYKPFPQLIAVCTMAGREKSGAGTYDFRKGGSEKMVKKDAHWTTVGLHGTEWRLVVMHIRPGF